MRKSSERRRTCRTARAVSMATRRAVEQSHVEIGTQVGCNMTPMPRVLHVLLQPEDGVEKWAELLTWRHSSALGLEVATYNVCRLLEAWVAVMRMRGDPVVQQCMQEGKVRCSWRCCVWMLCVFFVE